MGKLHEKMFVAQTTLESWVESGRAEFDGQVVTLRAHRRTYDLLPAVQFVSVVGGSGDQRLLGRVIAESRISDLGGELLGDSLVFGENAFQVRPGYVAVLRGGGP